MLLCLLAFPKNRQHNEMEYIQIANILCIKQCGHTRLMRPDLESLFRARKLCGQNIAIRPGNKADETRRCAPREHVCQASPRVLHTITGGIFCGQSAAARCFLPRRD